MTLEGTLTATVDDGVEFRFAVENAGSDPVELQFSDGQTFDIVVTRDGEEVWSFAEGMMFMQMLQQEHLEPGGSVVYDAEWEAPEEGEYEACAVLTATNADCEATTTFSV